MLRDIIMLVKQKTKAKKNPAILSQREYNPLRKRAKKMSDTQIAERVAYLIKRREQALCKQRSFRRMVIL